MPNSDEVKLLTQIEIMLDFLGVARVVFVLSCDDVALEGRTS